MVSTQFYDRELSWLSFNYRVLQEAKDKSNPLFERIKFMAIYSSNLDEFFRVRVASLRSLLRLKQKSQEKLKFTPQKLLKQIHQIVNAQQEELGNIYRNEILPELKSNKIHLINESELDTEQKEFVKEYFYENVIQNIQPILLVKNKIKPFLKNRHLYLAVRLTPYNSEGKKRIRHSYALVEIPTVKFPRFVQLPEKDGKHFIMFLDDVIRVCLHETFESFDKAEAYAVKLTRDGDLNIDDEFTGNLLNKIKKGLKKRDTGVPSRFLYDLNIPKSFLKFLSESLDLEKEDLVPGGRYHNFSDFFTFPNPRKPELENKPFPPLQHKELGKYNKIFNAIDKKDYALHFPYQSYDYVVKFLQEAADNANVTSIKITQYRVAKDSAIVKSLIRAAQSGKDVMAFVEVKARFDEELNIQWAEEMERAGVKVFYSFPGLKVHAKIALVTKNTPEGEKKYGYLGTGNFNEKTAKIYADTGLLTSDERLTNEIEKVFEFLSGNEIEYKFKHLLVAQFNMRKKFLKMINKEIENKQAGKDAWITIKLNSLEDRKMIKRLYKASQAGVEINILVRGICCLVPGMKGLSENINVISILDMYLEHARYYVFCNDGDTKVYAASADWMKRNLSRRIEVGFPFYDEGIKKEILDIIEIQLHDNTKARIINAKHKNEYKRNDEPLVRSQTELYNYFKRK